jgi:hypothetical protein
LFLRDNRFLRDRRVQIGGAVVIVGAVVAGFLYFGGNDDEGSVTPEGDDAFASGEDVAPTPGENVASSLEGGPETLLYLSDDLLQRKELKTSEDEEVTTLTDALGTDIGAASPWLAYVSAKDTGSGPPNVYLLNLDTEEEKEVGAGYSPTWDVAGARLAYLKPADPEECDAGGCTSYQVFTTDPESAEERPLIEDEGFWTIFGWSGDYLLVGNSNTPNTIVAVSADGEQHELEIPVADVLAPSPDGSWLLSRDKKGMALVPLADGGIDGKAEKIDIGANRVISATWSNASDSVAVILEDTTKQTGLTKEEKDRLREAGRKPKDVVTPPTSRLVVFSPDDPEMKDVEESFGAAGTPLWSPDDQQVFFIRKVDAEGNLQTFLCPVEAKGECTLGFSFTESSPLQFLRIE